MATDVIRVSTEAEIAPAAEAGVRVLRKGGLVGFATETVYGIAAAATDARTIERLRELKERPSRPFSVHVGGADEVGRYVGKPLRIARRLIDRGWPGPITLLVPAGGRLADRNLRRRKGLYERLCFNDFLGLRCPDEPVARAMLSAVRVPVVAPSANLAGRPSPRSGEEVLADLDGRIDLLIDSGPTALGTDSTIVRCDGDGWEVLREGAVSAAEVRRMARRTILIVCTGNTCRSAMAGGLAKKMLADELGCRVGELPSKGERVLSAGLFAADGARATREAVIAARQLGADISRHRSRQLTRELIHQADLVWCMTDSHVADVLRMAPEAGEKVRRLDPRGDVPDPIGSDREVYVRTAGRIVEALKVAFSEGQS